ncbi:hypothetical protein [Inovirus sp.]|nr:hypothetical protein [Inovirus sp.]
MKKFFALITAFFVLCSSVSAVELDSSSSNEQTSEDVSKIEEIIPEVPAKSPVADVSGQEDTSVPSDSEVPSGGNPIYVLEAPASSGGANYGDLTDIPVGASIDNITVTSVSPVEPSDTSGLKSALLGVLGSYDPVIVEYEYSDRNGYKNYLRDVQPDYVWLCSCALLALVIYCLFRLGGALIRE